MKTVKPRSYRLGRRAEQQRANEGRIIEAARTLLMEQGFIRVTLDEVARGAGVTRATIYNRFGSRSGLLAALDLDAARRAGIDPVLDAFRLPDPVEAARGVVGESCRFWEAERPVFRNLINLAAVDEEAAGVIAGLDAKRRSLCSGLAGRLVSAGALDRGYSRPLARDTLFLVSGFQAGDVLRRSGASADSVARTLACVVEAMIAA